VPLTRPVLEFHDVSKSFRQNSARVDALVRVSLAIWPGEFVVLTGPSGSGKSTLLHLASALETPTSGTVELAGVDLRALEDDELSRLRCSKVGLIFQAFHLIDYLTAEENVALPLRFAGLPAAKATAQARDMLGRVGLGPRARHRPGELSGGEMQRVAIARALVVRPELLLADEPTGNLDSRAAADILELLRQLNEQERVAVLLATHDERAAASAPRILELRDGAVVAASAASRAGTPAT
jgi:ABC-type lipoprotein export system ATPase subunit